MMAQTNAFSPAEELDILPPTTKTTMDLTMRGTSMSIGFDDSIKSTAKIIQMQKKALEEG